MGSGVSTDRSNASEQPIAVTGHSPPEQVASQTTVSNRKTPVLHQIPLRASQFRSVDLSPKAATEDVAELSARREGTGAQSFTPVTSRAASPSILSASAMIRRPPSVTFSDSALVITEVGSRGGCSALPCAPNSEPWRSARDEELDDTHHPFLEDTTTPIGSQESEYERQPPRADTTGNPSPTPPLQSLGGSAADRTAAAAAAAESDPAAPGLTTAVATRRKLTALHVKHCNQLAVPKGQKLSLMVL